MKKYSFLIFHKDYSEFLHTLRELGVVHIFERRLPGVKNNDIVQLVRLGRRFRVIIHALNKIKKEHEINELHPENPKEDGVALLEKIEHLYADREKKMQRKNMIARELQRISPWGYFDLENLRKLEQAGFFIHFHTVLAAKFEKTWIDEYNAIKINQQGSTIYFVTVTSEATPPDIDDVEEVKPFEKSAISLEVVLAAIDEEINQIDEALTVMVKNDLNTLIYKEEEARDQINWEKVAHSSETAAAGKLMLLEGFVPEEKEAETTAALNHEGVYFEVSTPTPNEKPPVLLKNNRFTKHFEFISNLYDRPNYHAFDLTPFFAPFYVLFFGMCVGDCGYGLIYILLSVIFSKSKNPFMKSVNKLLLWLGIGTVIFGFISGTFFGIPLVKQSWQWLESFKVIMLDHKKLFYAAFVCGGVQLIYAMIINVITKWMRFGFLRSLNMMGWIITIISIGWIVLIYKSVVTGGIPMPLLYITCGAGLCMMLFFNNPEKGLKGIPGSIGSGLFGIFNKASGLLGDILSYIRLFALGISGSVMGLIFNSLAFSFAPDVVVLRQLVVVLILVIGHALNIFMCSLGASVHPMRLTFVEFYNNAGFEGNGKPYAPFKKRT